MKMNVLFVGDIVGEPGRKALFTLLPGLVAAHGIDFVIVNGENSAHGSGLTINQATRMLDAGVHVITLGDHCYKRMEIADLMRVQNNVLRPANLPSEAHGSGWTVIQLDGLVPVGVITLLGRVFMGPADCPFHAVDHALADIGERAKVVFIDMHAEATSEKIAMARYLDGRASAVVGTHTHVPTADETVFPNGTAFICDVGMTGPHDSVIGRQTEPVLHKFITQMHAHFDVAKGDVRLNGVVVTVDTDTGRALSIKRVVEKLD